jgi:hypothetical protein
MKAAVELDRLAPEDNGRIHRLIADAGHRPTDHDDLPDPTRLVGSGRRMMPA